MKLRHYRSDDKNKILIFLPERIDNLNITELEENISQLLEESDAENIILEASELNYLSSIGIRMLLKLRSSGKHVEIIRVRPEIKDTLVQVGINEVIPVFSEDKVVFTRNLKVLKERNDFIVYLLEKDKALKVAKNDRHKDDILKEKNSIREAFLLGIPTLIPYDYVRTTDGRYGLIYELPEAKSFETLITENPEDEESLIKTFVDKTREIHQIEIPRSPHSVSQKEGQLEPLVKKNILNKEEEEKIRSFFDYIPDSDHFLHTHLDFKNIIETTEKDILFTHIIKLATGHPVLDLYRLYYTYYLLPEYDMNLYTKVSDLPVEKGKDLTDKVIREYFQIETQEELDKIYKQLRIIALIAYLEKVNRNIDKRDEALNEKIKKELFEDLENVELITF